MLITTRSNNGYKIEQIHYLDGVKTKYWIKDVPYEAALVYKNRELALQAIKVGCSIDTVRDMFSFTPEEFSHHLHTPISSLLRYLSTIEESAKPEFVSEMCIVHRFFIMEYYAAGGLVKKIWYDADLEFDYSREFDSTLYSVEFLQKAANDLWNWAFDKCGHDEISAIRKVASILGVNDIKLVTEWLFTDAGVKR